MWWDKYPMKAQRKSGEHKDRGRTKKRTLAALPILVAVFALLAASCSSSSSSSSTAKPQAAKGGSYVVGSTGDLSGPAAAVGGALRDGYEAYFSYVNSHGGIDGHKVKLISLDDASNPTTGVANTKQLTEIDHVNAELVFLSTVLVAAAPVLESTKTPTISQGITTSLLQPVNPYMFAGDIVIGDEAAPVVNFAATKVTVPHPRVAIFSLQVADNANYVAKAEQLIKAKGWDLVNYQQVPMSATTAAPEATAIASSKPDLVIMALPEPWVISAVQSLRQQGFKGPIVNYDGGSAYSTLKTLADPNFYVVRPFPYYVKGQPSPGPEFTKFVAAAKAISVDPNRAFLINGYVQAWVLGHALAQCGYPCAGPKLASTLAHLHLNTGGLTYGNWSYSPNNHVGIHEIRFVHWDVSTSEPVPASGLLPIGS
jgi:ABC-type branched-subunit amino acid transport system substrate-binding protein